MGSTGVVRALAAVWTAGVAGVVLTGCGSAGVTPATAEAAGAAAIEHEAPAAAGGGDPFVAAVSWPASPGRLASLTGQLSSTGQVDVYDLGPVYAGDRIHVEVYGSGALDAAVAVLDEDQNVLITNDDRSYYGGLIDPLAEALVQHASAKCYVAVSVSPLGNTAGAYTLEVLLTEDPVPAPPETQHVYLNFEGADEVVIGGRPAVDVPVFDAASIDAAFAGHTDEIIDLMLSKVRADYTGLNVVFHSSREDPPPAEPYSTLHFGQFDAELLGVAENVDEFNLDTEQQAIIFADTFGAFSVANPSVEEIAQALANVASHETGHLLGLYHCADPREVMDVTATLRQMLADQSFSRAPLHAEYFPVGYQDAVQVLIENVGGDLAVAKEAAAAQQVSRSSWYDADPGPPARSQHIFGTCSRCLHDKAYQYRQRAADQAQPPRR